MIDSKAKSFLEIVADRNDTFEIFIYKKQRRKYELTYEEILADTIKSSTSTND